MPAAGVNLSSGSLSIKQVRCCVQGGQRCANPQPVKQRSRYSVDCRSKFIGVHSCYGNFKADLARKFFQKGW
jgi:hypothetical protein